MHDDIDIHTQSKAQSTQRESRLDTVVFRLLLMFGFLVPFFFIPGLRLGSDVPVSLLLALTAGCGAIVYYVSVFRRGEIVLPHAYFFWALCAVNVIFFFSALLSGNIKQSLVGFGGEIGTTSFIFLCSSLLLLTASTFTSKDKVFSAYVAFFSASVVVALHHVIRLIFGADVLSFGIFTTQTESVLGSWNNVAIFFGASTLICLMTMHLLKLSSVLRFVMSGMTLVSVFFLVLVNFTPVWVVIGLCSLAIWIYYQFYAGHVFPPGSTFVRIFSHLSLMVFLCALIFVIGGTKVHTPIAQTFNVAVAEVRPSWSATTEIGKHILRESFFWGSGPNTFKDAWLTYKPAGVNETIFFNIDFNSGIAFIPTVAITTGALGLLAMTSLIVLFIYTGYSVLSRRIEDIFTRYIVVSSFAISLYLWVMLLVYTPSASMLVLTFFFTGLFFAISQKERLVSMYIVPFAHHPRVGFIAVAGLVFLTALMVLTMYSVTKSALSQVYFVRGMNLLQTEEGIVQGEQFIQKALALDSHDIHYRTLANIEIYRINRLIISEPGDRSVEELQSEFQNRLTQAISYMNKAILLDRSNYQNWLHIAKIYMAIAVPPFSIEGAYENAQQSLAEAERLYPTSPAITLERARLELSQNKLSEGRMLIAEALQKKRNYLDAYFLLSQIEASTGNIAEAIQSAENSAFLAPDNPGIFFHLGLLYYNNNSYEQAISAFERAIQLVPEYSNAKYFLGLTLDKIGRRQEAITLFEEVYVLNPDNAELELILDNLRQDRDPFTNAEPPIDDEPESRSELPLAN